MTPHDRFTSAMEHREPDRVPIDLGGIVTGISTGASASLKARLGIGFVFAAGHNIQADVPAEHILALFDAADEFGVY